MSQYRGYYTSSSSNTRNSTSPQDGGSSPPKSSISSSMPFIVNGDDDFEYDRNYINQNKRPFSEVESCSNGLSNLDNIKHQKVNHYYSSSSSSNGYSSTSSQSGYSSSSNSNYSHNQRSKVTQKEPDDASIKSNSTSPPYTVSGPVLSPELAMPVFQTADRCNEWEMLKPVVKSCDDLITIKSETSEKWAWGTGNKWVGASGPRPKLNVYSGTPKVEMFTNARKVSGGIGEKLLQQMGWREGEGLGKSREGATEPIAFNEIKTDRKGLVSNDDASHIKTEENVQEKTKSKYSQLKSTSFWNWHGSGMKGPENVNARLRNEKKAAKEKTLPTLDLSGKHPVSALMELCSKKKWKEPKFINEECGTGFKFKVEVNGSVYTPKIICDNKKGARAESARNCLVEMGWTL